MLNWTQPNPNRNDYWQSDKHDFWVTSKQIYNLADQTTRRQWVLFNDDHELGVYYTLAEAQNAAEPAHGVNEAPEDTPVCYWCSGTHPGQICANAPYYVKQ